LLPSFSLFFSFSFSSSFSSSDFFFSKTGCCCCKRHKGKRTALQQKSAGERSKYTGDFGFWKLGTFFFLLSKMKRGKVFLVMEKKKNDARRRRLSLSLARVKTARKKKGGRLHPREARVPQLPPPLKKVRESGKKNWTEKNSC
jgi:hypothetical protein